MKHPYTLYFLLFFCLVLIERPGLHAQTQRMVLIEEATNASCGPCAAQNPAFDALLNQNRDKLTAIKYHWYFPGYDPMHLHNPGENNARVAYYGINGVPTAVIDGVIPSGPGFGYPGAPSGFSQNLINQYYAIPAPFYVHLYHYLSPAQDSIHVIMRITAAQNISGSFKAHMAVVEKKIQFASPPGSNGETTFYDVMKKMLPNHLGTNIPANWETGDYIILRESWKLANIYNMNQLGVVGFIQENGTKSVKQAGNSDNQPFPAWHATDAAIYNLTNLTATNCSGIYSPVITLANFGSNPLTSAEIHYRVNQGPVQVYQWSGNLAYLQTTEIQLPDISFVVLPQNQLEIELLHPNGINDQYTKNNLIVYPFNAAVATPSEVKLMIKLDNNPGEITWDVKNMAGQIIHSGGPYTTPGATINVTMNFTENGCYLFSIYDSGGNGLQAPGFFALYYGSSSQILTGTTFGSVARAQFDVGGTVNIADNDLPFTLRVYPNPIPDQGAIEIHLWAPSSINLYLTDLTGRKVSMITSGTYQAGLYTLPLKSENLSSGIYLLKGTIDNHQVTEKIIISH